MTLDPLEPRRHLAFTPCQAYGTTITKPGQQKSYVVHLDAGDKFILAAADRRDDPAFRPTLRLFDPAGRKVRTSTGDKAALLATTVRKTGDYTVRVGDAGRARGSLALTAFYVGDTPVIDGDDAASPVRSGRRYAATIGPGDLDVWRIDATQGQFLDITASEHTAGAAIGLNMVIVGPNYSGRPDATVATNGNARGAFFQGNNLRTGTYYAVVYETNLVAADRYDIGFALAPAAGAVDPDETAPLVRDVPRDGTVLKGDIDVFRVPVAARQTLTATLTATGGNIRPLLRLIDPNGFPVDNQTGDSTSTLTSYPEFSVDAGVWTIFVLNNRADAGGTYRLSYTLT